MTGEDWRAPIAGDEFDPLVDRYLNRAAFSAPVGQLGNAPRMNGAVRRPWNLSENVSLAKTISMTNQLRLDVRVEAFNVFNRVIWGEPEHELQQRQLRPDHFASPGFAPRQMQFGLKLYW